ncbi:unnamed protein product [Adineta ricciae]|uniref:Secreted protein n=1 Tax=Adineta ricciae TaxID=249248 RepID=A0A815CI76_ADIRI|nr:unnamed protein product [Adineta ricciae]CAF1287833.1 unnamed protein product [Adineta ricciae]
MFYLLLIVLICCGNIVTGKSAKLVTVTVTLGVNENTEICCDANLQVSSIQDSRCPLKMACIWAGQAKVGLLLSNSEGSSTTELIIGAQSKPNALVAVDSKSYNVTLVQVTPYPGASKNPSQATVQIICP